MSEDGHVSYVLTNDNTTSMLWKRSGDSWQRIWSQDDSGTIKYVLRVCPTDYNAAGAAGFFQKLLDLEQAGSTPQFLSTHPSPDNRVQNINTQKVDEGCTGTGTFVSRYQQLKNSLP